MDKITELKPNIIWKYFNEILQVPRPSKKEEKMIAYLETFAKKNNLEYKKDKVGNVVILKAATPGYENRKKVILQSHVDMVCEKNSGIEHDFNTDPIPAYIDDGWIKAKGTTLGADNGIGIAAQLAVLTDQTLEHGPVECLFTIDEETGLTGAFNMGKDLISGEILINLDSEDEGEIFMGCAGGVDTLATIPYEHKPLKKDFMGLTIGVRGLKGGHSGDDIEKGLGNSNKILIRLIWNAMQEFDIRLAEFNGGNLRNAIPREAKAKIAVHEMELKSFLKYVDTYKETIKNEFKDREPNLDIFTEKVAAPEFVMKRKSQSQFVNMLFTIPNGVIEMSHDMPGLVETSTNLASIKFLPENNIEVVTSQRSSVESAKKDIANRIKCHLEFAKADAHHTDSYPGWTPNTDSKILRITQSSYLALFQKEAKIKAIHAGLECGLFLEKYPHLDMVSIGPTILGAHSPDERMEIETVDKFWKLLIEMLKNIPEG